MKQPIIRVKRLRVKVKSWGGAKALLVTLSSFALHTQTLHADNRLLHSLSRQPPRNTKPSPIHIANTILIMTPYETLC